MGKKRIFEQSEENSTNQNDEDNFRHRCLPSKIIHLLEGLKGHPEEKSRLRRIKDAGFGAMLDLFPLKQIPHFFLKFSVESFIGDGCYFKLDDGRILYLTEDDVQRVYDLPRGPLKINLKESTQDARNRLLDDLKFPRSGNVRLVSSKMFETVIINQQQTEDNWFKIAILYMIGSLICPQECSKISLKYADILQTHLTELAKFNWCEHVLKHTAKSLAKKDIVFYKANFHFLLFNYFDHMGLQCCLYTNQVQPPTCTSYGDMIQVKKDLVVIHRIVGLGSAVKAGMTNLPEETKKDSKNETIYSYFNPYTCPADKVLQHLEVCVNQISIFKDHLEILNKRIAYENLDKVNKNKDGKRSRDENEKKVQKKAGVMKKQKRDVKKNDDVSRSSSKTANETPKVKVSPNTLKNKNASPSEATYSCWLGRTRNSSEKSGSQMVSTIQKNPTAKKTNVSKKTKPATISSKRKNMKTQIKPQDGPNKNQSSESWVAEAVLKLQEYQPNEQNDNQVVEVNVADVLKEVQQTSNSSDRVHEAKKETDEIEKIYEETGDVGETTSPKETETVRKNLEQNIPDKVQTSNSSEWGNEAATKVDAIGKKIEEKLIADGELNWIQITYPGFENF